MLRTHGNATVADWVKTTQIATQQTALLWNGGNFYVQTEAAGLPALPFLLDSGAGANGVWAETLQKHGKTLDGGLEGNSTTAGGSSAVRTGLEGAFSVAAEPARNGTLFVKACPSKDAEGVAKSGYVGAPWFYGRRVFFPVDRKTIAFTVP